MIRSLIGWVEHRTNLRKVVDALLLEHIPGGARWRYVWGSCLMFVFALQVVTGVLLMTAYSPGETTAWGSVFFIQYQMDFGWLIRGLHHFGSQAMVVLLFIHMLQVVIAGAQLPPREVNWWLGLLLMAMVLGLSLTGYLLPWDQKGYWATRVATTIMSGVPFIGPWLQNILIGGTEYGNATLTRFFALHVAILPGLLVLILVAHLALFRRHGITYPGYPKRVEGSGWFWPEQVFRDTIACLVVLGVLLFLVLSGHGYPVTPHTTDGTAAAADSDLYTHWARAGQLGLGANLDAPADPQSQYDPRPEWYYLFLFQLLKNFPGDQVFIGTQVIPGAAAMVLFLLPLLGFGRLRPLGHIVGVVVVVGLIAAIVSLTCLALADDAPQEIPHVLLNRIAWYVVPGVAVVYLLHLIIAGALSPESTLRKLYNPLGLLILFVLMVATGGLVYVALGGEAPDVVHEKIAEIIKKQIEEKERANPDAAKDFDKSLKLARDFQKAVKESAEQAERAIELAHALPPDAGGNVPVEGAALLLQRDPKTQFKPLFLKNCAACHSYADDQVVSADSLKAIKPQFEIRKEKDFQDAAKVKFTASDLAGFGTHDWIFNFLKDPSAPRFFGRIKDSHGDLVHASMSKFVARRYKDAKKAGDKGVAELEADFSQIATWLATHPTKTDFKDPAHAKAFELFTKKFDCISCHQYANLNKTAVTAPDLTGYAGPLWLHKMIRSPGHPELYGARNILEEEKLDAQGKPLLDKAGNPVVVRKNMMPSFFPSGTVQADLQRLDFQLLVKDSILLKAKIQEDKEPTIPAIEFAELSDIDRELIVRYLTGDYRLVFGGSSITGVQPKQKE